MKPREELETLLGTLSDLECRHLLHLFRGTAEGERAWEDDLALYYNEFVKMRYYDIQDESIAPGAPLNPNGEEELFAPIPLVKSYDGATRVELSRPEPLPADLGSILRSRRSRRDFSGAAISEHALSTVLSYACGVTGYGTGYGYRRLPLRAFPSSGGLQAPEVYLSVQAVECIESGIYHYRPLDHQLELVRRGEYAPMLQKLALGQPFVGTASVLFLVTGYYDRLRWKYGERGYRYMCIDSGYLGANISLVAEALELGTCGIAGFFDDPIQELLCVDGDSEVILLLLALGSLADRGQVPASSGQEVRARRE